MIGIIYKFTIIAKYKFDGHKPFYVGQHFGLDDFDTYDGSGKIWNIFIKRLKKEFPTCWRKLIKREVLYQHECSQKALDKLEEYYIKKCKSHYSYGVGGCNILWGTANKFGSGNPSKDPLVRKKHSKFVINWWKEHPKEKEKLSKRRSGTKTPKYIRDKISKSLIGMFAGDKNPMFGKKFSEETKKKMSLAQSKRKHRKSHSEETKRKISEKRKKYVGEKHPLYGCTFIWINNGVINKRGKINELIPKGWVRGKIQRK